MATPDRRAARTAAVGVLLVAVTAAVISFSHVRSVAIRAGETQLTSWLLPISIDGAVVAAVSVLLADSRAGRRPAALTWLLLGLGISASLVANIASAEPTATARAVAAWPPLALALGIEVLAGLARRNGRPRPEEANIRPVAAQPVATGLTGSGAGGPTHALDAGGIFGMLPPSRTGSSNGRDADRPAALDDGSAVELIRRLDMAAPTGRVSRLEIQKALGCGGSRAARLAELARSAGARAADKKVRSPLPSSVAWFTSTLRYYLPVASLVSSTFASAGAGLLPPKDSPNRPAAPGPAPAHQCRRLASRDSPQLIRPARSV